MTTRFTDVVLDGGNFSGYEEHGIAGGPVKFSACWELFLVKEAWNRGADMEDLADGFGAGMGTCGGDWSGIRDSTPAARTLMVQRALNHLFG